LFARPVPNACMVTDLSRKFASKDADFGMHCSGELRQSFRMRTTRRIGFRHGSVVTARTYKRPEQGLTTNLLSNIPYSKT
jgi:hypothetical protein